MRTSLAAILGLLALVSSGSLSQVQAADSPFLRGVNGGTNCVACSVVVALVEQLGIVYNETVDASLARLCNYLPQGMFRTACTDAVKQFGPIIISGIYAKETPDVICHAIGFCFTEKGQPECRMFPAPKNTIKSHSDSLRKKLTKQGVSIPQGPPSICKNKAFEKICAYFERVFDTHEPAVDLDKDSHSTYQSLRGTSWRGRDCNDLVHGIHPGAKPLGDDSLQDTNCNGIFGRPQDSDQSYEDKFCKNSQQMGVAILGDSLSAHFHLPEEWFDATKISADAFKHVAFVIENEADWPHLSIYTGYMNNSWPIIEGPTKSIYLKMLERNRCNFRDYANVAVNGARTGSMLDIMKYLNRSKTNDQPLLLGYSLVGNDVCNGHPDTFDHMTKPDEFYNNVIQAMDYLDTVLPAGSHIFLTGLANGSVLYEAMGDIIYPIGRTKNDVTYKDMYTYLSCLQISPCNGWMTTNATVRQMTTDYAMMLSDLVKNVTLTRKYKNFDMYYLEFPLEQIFADWKAMGGEVWQLIEPVDGFHMSQFGHSFGADAVWKLFSENRPNWLGPINPFNDDIAKIFGNQGGY